MSKLTLTITDRERDTILAALRLWQDRPVKPAALLEIAENDHGQPLDNDEIDALCEDINCS